MHWMKVSCVSMVSAIILLQVAAQTVGQTIRNERLKILAIDGAPEDYFGYAVAISGATSIVGAYLDDDNGMNSGSAYLFDATTGVHVAKLLANDGEAGDAFGYAVAISGATSIVGAYLDDDNGANSGSAYFFDTTTGVQLVKLRADDGAAEDRFGCSVGISGASCVIGAYEDDDSGAESGSAYLFDANAGMQILKLRPADGEAGDRFGWCVAISGATAIVGAFADDENGSNSGSAYLFDATTGAQIAKLLASDGAAEDWFGRSVGINGAMCIVGAYLDDDNGMNSGSAYLFDATTGMQIAKLLPTDGEEGDWFGVSVAISGGTCAVGAQGKDDVGPDSGSAYLFDAISGQQSTKLRPSDGAAIDLFGLSVGLSEVTCVVGAPYDDDRGEYCGSAYLFQASRVVPPLTLELSGACPGHVVFTVTDATPAGLIAIVYGLGDGPTTIPVTLPCAGAILDVGNPNLANRIILADANGVAVLNTNLPATACDRVRVQALDLTTCEVSEVVRP